MASEIGDDLVLDVASALARGGTTRTGPACCRTTCRARRRHRRPTIMALTELGDLAIKPRETLLHLGTLSFERVNDLLHPRQHHPLVRGSRVSVRVHVSVMKDLRQAVATSSLPMLQPRIRRAN